MNARLQHAPAWPCPRVDMTEFDNIRELLEMPMSEHTPAKHKIKMKTSFGWEPAMNASSRPTASSS